jgi:ABC-type Fe3+-hydroxamate transport system substrate-binding protein
MNKFLKAGAALALAVSLAACGSTSTDTSASSTAAAETTAAASEAPATSGTYTVTNKTGETVTELYFYLNGSDDKGTNYADGGLADGDVLTVNLSVDESEASEYAEKGMTVEYVTESGVDAIVFDNLHLEEAPMYLKPQADIESGATPFLEESAAASASADSTASAE